MIVFDLKCDKGHLFEAWFRDGATFERQQKRGHVACATCGSTKVVKAPMAPRIARRRGGGAKSDPGAVEAPADAQTVRVEAVGAYANHPDAKQAAKLFDQLRQLRDHVEKTCDYVGDRFPEEARKMHYKEVARRNIYGEASDTEAKELADEGIEVGRIPWLPRRNA